MFGSLVRISPVRQRFGRFFLHQRFIHNRLFAYKNNKQTTERFIASGSLTLAGVVGLGGFLWYKQDDLKTVSEVHCRDEDNQSHQNEENITLYQFASCPFCNKVRTFLDYYGMKYDIVEVDPLFKKEIKFSEYKRVPIVVIQGNQLHDSSLIISVLRSYLLKQDSLEELLKYYPPITVQGSNNKDTIEYANRYGIMFKTDFNESRVQEIKLERKWRRWVDNTFVHTLSPNIYRTWQEAMEASEHFSHVGDFSATQRFLAKYFGAVIMYYIGKKMKKKYRLKDDVREAMYDEIKVFMKALGKKKFLGGKTPNLADLAMFGVLRGIEELSTVKDIKKHTKITPWFDRMKHAVENHEGAALVAS